MKGRLSRQSTHRIARGIARAISTIEFSPSELGSEGVGRSAPGCAAGAKLDSQLPARYVFRGQLGRGAMGTVLDVEDRYLGRRVALKVLTRNVPVAARS